mgnify:CR=1 FL=1
MRCLPYHREVEERLGREAGQDERLPVGVELVARRVYAEGRVGALEGEHEGGVLVGPEIGVILSLIHI